MTPFFLLLWHYYWDLKGWENFEIASFEWKCVSVFSSDPVYHISAVHSVGSRYSPSGPRLIYK